MQEAHRLLVGSLDEVVDWGQVPRVGVVPSVYTPSGAPAAQPSDDADPEGLAWKEELSNIFAMLKLADYLPAAVRWVRNRRLEGLEELKKELVPFMADLRMTMSERVRLKRYWGLHRLKIVMHDDTTVPPYPARVPPTKEGLEDRFGLWRKEEYCGCPEGHTRYYQGLPPEDCSKCAFSKDQGAR